MRTTVHMLRHGEVENPTRIMYGRLAGYRLSALGRQMAAAAAKSLAGRDITYLAASPLERAQETAEPSADLFQLPVTTDERLIESDNVFEGTGPGAWRQLRHWWVLRNPFLPSWGEPYGEIALRMSAALFAARDAAAGHEALCVSHQLPIWTLRLFTMGRRLWHDPRRRQCALASITSFHFDGDSLVGIEYSQPAAHLVVNR